MPAIFQRIQKKFGEARKERISQRKERRADRAEPTPVETAGDEDATSQERQQSDDDGRVLGSIDAGPAPCGCVDLQSVEVLISSLNQSAKRFYDVEPAPGQPQYQSLKTVKTEVELFRGAALGLDAAGVTDAEKFLTERVDFAGCEEPSLKHDVCHEAMIRFIDMAQNNICKE
jgi:hypothetical protein